MLVGLTQLICVWLATGGPGDSASFLFLVSLSAYLGVNWILADLGLFRLG